MNNKYSNEVLEPASKLDVLIEAKGEIIEYVKSIISKQDEEAVKKLFVKIANVISEKDCTNEIREVSKELKDSLIKYYGYQEIYSIFNQVKLEYDTRTLEDLEAELHEMIGLEKVKSQVEDLVAFQKVQRMREVHGLKKIKNTMHLAFLGNPGTGKTTVARIVGRIYKQIGLLSKGHFVEVSRTDLIAGYQGQTALKVKKVIEKSKGGVLFIDEAYSITENEHSDSYGRECLTELTKALEDYRDDLVVIVAGYIEPMLKFFDSNPGLKSRFNTFIHFDDYSVDQLELILIKMCKDDEYILDKAAKDKVREVIVENIAIKDKLFSNARFVRNLYDDIVMNHAKRIVNIEEPSCQVLSVITADDCFRIT